MIYTGFLGLLARVFRSTARRNLRLSAAPPFTNMQSLIAETIILCDIADTPGRAALSYRRAGQGARPGDGS